MHHFQPTDCVPELGSCQTCSGQPLAEVSVVGGYIRRLDELILRAEQRLVSGGIILDRLEFEFEMPRIGVDEQEVIDDSPRQFVVLTRVNLFCLCCMSQRQNEQADRCETLLAVNDYPLPGVLRFAHHCSEEVFRVSGRLGEGQSLEIVEQSRALRDLPIVVTLINGDLKSRVRSVIEFPDLCRLTLQRAPHYCLQLGRFLHRIGRFNLLRPSGLPLEACQTASYLFEANSADPTTPFGETTPPYYCRHQLGREEQGCASRSGGPSTEPHGSPAATLAAPAPRAPPARPSSPARSVSSASCRPGWGLRDRPSTVLSASHSIG